VVKKVVVVVVKKVVVAVVKKVVVVVVAVVVAKKASTATSPFPYFAALVFGVPRWECSWSGSTSTRRF
jgi:hypothetical protein